MKKIYLLFLLCANSMNLWAATHSPYISKVYDYNPAPGQFINELPEYEAGDTKDDMIRKVEECLVGDEKILVSLGAYGGSVTFGFDHMIVNVPGVYDFTILGNAFYASSNPNPNAPKEGGSSEPGIVMVSYDANGNGLPDDEWYELAGSEYSSAATIHNYKITYHKPDPNKENDPDTDYPFINDRSYIKWVSNQNTEGYVCRNTFHAQSYYPNWISDNTMSFTGTKLANNYTDESGNGSYYVQYSYPWGYADNQPNNNERSGFKIEWAVDKNGNKVHLPGINFVKVYTAVNQYCGWLGETSTEIMGAQDLHIDAAGVNDVVVDKNFISIINSGSVSSTLRIKYEGDDTIAKIYTLSGILYKTIRLTSGINEIDVENLASGIYLLNTNNKIFKFLRK